MSPRSFFHTSVALVVLGVGSRSALAQTTISTASTAAQTVPSSGSLTVTASGSLTVSGSTTAVTMSGGTTAAPTTLSNSGTINQTGTGRAVRANATGSNIVIQNLAGGVISATGNDTVAVGSGTVSSSNVTLTNAGTITGNGNQAVNFGNLTAGTNTINNSGTITAAIADAVRPGTNGTVNNTGTIMSTASNGSGSDGIDAQTNGGVGITNSAANAISASIIEGGRHGITGGNTAAGSSFTMSITNYARGTIQGDNGAGVNLDGISAAEVVTINNSGTITGNGSALATGATSQDGDGVDVDGVVNLTNSGTIRSLNSINDVSEGVTVGGGTINNSGTIRGSVSDTSNNTATGRGITIAGVDKDANGNPTAVQAPYAATHIINSGTIKGDSDSGIAFTSTLASGFSNTITNQAGGLIEGGGATAAIQTGADNDTVVNSGTIKADSGGAAIDLGGGTNTLQITGGSAQIVGSISGGASSTNSALTVDPGSGNSFAYNGVISNFATVGISSGTVTFAGASTYTGTTTVAGGAVLNVVNTTGSATGTAAVTVQNNGSLAGTGAISGVVSIAAGGRLTLGNDAASTLTVGGLSLVDGSRFTLNLGADGASEQLNVLGALVLNGSGQVIFDVASDSTTGRYVLATFGSQNGLTVDELALGNVPAGFSGTFDITGNTVGLTVNAVPEPSALLMLVLPGGLAGLVVRRRQRRASRTTALA